MANVKLSELTAATSVADANEFEINESGTSKKVTAAQIQAYIESNLTSGTKILKGDGSGGVADATTTNGTSGQYLKTNGDGTFDWESVVTFDSGTAMIFAQSTAPTGWTKSTTHNDKALRVTSGTASSGGSVAFSTAFASQGVSVSGTTNSVATTGTVGNHTLATNRIPSHTHLSYGRIGNGNRNLANGIGGGNYGNNKATSATGGGAAHNHSFTGSSHSHTFSGTDTIDLTVQYVDVIIATKD